MKFLKNKSLLFKLILTLFITVLGISSFGNSSVMAKHQDRGNPTTGTFQEHCGIDPDKTAERGTTVYRDGCYEENGKVYQEDGTEYKRDGDNNNYAPNPNVDNVTSNDREHSLFEIGGKLLQPIVDLLVSLGDGIMTIVQKAILGGDAGVGIDISTSWIKIIIGILAAVVAVVLIVSLTGGIGAAVASLGKLTEVVAIKTAIATVGSAVTKVVVAGSIVSALAGYKVAITAYSGAFLPDLTFIPTFSVSPEEIFEGKLLIFDVNFFNPKKDVYVKIKNQDQGILVEDYNNKTPEEQKNLIIEYYYYMDGTDKVITSKQNTSMILSPTIAKWYFTIRNIVLVVMMSILVYVGIRIMLCSIASEKAKYKKMLMDWITSICLVFVLHYIMVFAVNINDSIVKLIEASTDKNQESFTIDLESMDNRKDNFIKAVKKSDLKNFLTIEGESIVNEDGTLKSGTPTEFTMPVNLIGRVRMLAQMQNGTAEYIGYAIAYMVLVFYTIFFTFTYLKRVLYLAFLTVIAPFVAMTYSIDKINDGKAQAFNIWLKEYIFNLLIQPLHLMLYMILISMAYELASENIIYTLVAIGFMMPAEKLIRSMFGFEKAKTPGFLGGAVGAGLAMGAISNLSKLGGGSKKSNKTNGNNTNNGNENARVRQADSDAGMPALINGMTDENSNDVGSSVENSDAPNSNDQNYNDSNDNDLNDNNQQTLEGINNEQEEFDQNSPINFDTYEPEQYFDDPEEYNEWMDLATLPDDQKSEENNQRQAELEGKANAAKKAKNIRMLEESKRRQANRPIMQMGRMDKAKNAARRFNDKYKVTDALKSSVKGGVRLTGTVLGAGLAASASIASGNPQSLPQNIAAGIAAGGTLAGGIVNRTGNLKGEYDKNKIEAEKEKYGDKYQEYLNSQIDKETFSDPKLRKFYEQKFSSDFAGLSKKEKNEKMDRLMNNVIEYNRNGVNDHEIIAKTMKLEENQANRASNENITAALIASRAKDYKTVKEYNGRLAEKIGKEKATNITNRVNRIREDNI